MKSPNNTSPSPSDNVYINNNHVIDDDEDDEQQQNEPLFNNSIKMGPFSIRYSPTTNKKKKKRYTNDNDDDLVQYEDKREGREILHDFAMTQSVFDIEDNYDDHCDDGNGLYGSSRRRIPLRIILLGESYNYVCGCSIICNEQYIARLISLLSSSRDVSVYILNTFDMICLNITLLKQQSSLHSITFAIYTSPSPKNSTLSIINTNDILDPRFNQGTNTSNISKWTIGQTSASC